MRVEEEYKKSGYFWLPENPNNKIPGTLTIADGGKIELEIVGLFHNITQTFDDNEDLSRIVGHIEDDGLVTLDDCFYLEKNISFGGISKSRVHVHRVLSGVAYDKDEVVTFDSLSFSVECMDEWIGISGINVESDFQNRTATINYKRPNNFIYSINNGMKLEICFAYSSPFLPNITEAKITQKTYFRLLSDELRLLSDFIGIAHKLTNLLCFAVDSTVSIKGLSATSSELLQDMGVGKTRPVPISIYYESILFAEKKPKVNWHNMIFTFGIIKENAEEVFNNWIDTYDILAPAFGLYFSAKTNAQKYLEGKFLALAQGLETYHRRTSKETLMDDSEFNKVVAEIMQYCPEDKIVWLEGRLKYGNEIYFSKRIEKMIEPFKKHIGNHEERKKIIRKIVDTRNYLTHYNEELKENIAQGKDIWVICLKMEVIFQLHFLYILGFTDNEISNVIENSYPLKQKLNDV